MSERERWIVYPLLFFALGAAVRDKILHRVDAKEIYCESLKIVDQQDPLGLPLVELGIQRSRSADPEELAGRVGLLRLIDSEGQVVCHVAGDAYVPHLNAEQLVIRDKDQRPMIALGVEQGPGIQLPNGQQAATPYGVIYVIDEKLQGMKLTPHMHRQPAQRQPADESL